MFSTFLTGVFSGRSGPGGVVFLLNDADTSGVFGFFLRLSLLVAC